MKKGFLFLYIISFTFVSLLAQKNGLSKPKSTMISYSAPKYKSEETSVASKNYDTGLPTAPTVSTSSDFVLAMPNFLGYANPNQKQISADIATNSVAIINRQAPTFYNGGTSGHFRYNISTDAGQTWLAQAQGNLNAPQPSNGGGRYPNCLLFHPPNSTQSSLHIVAPYVVNGTWEYSTAVTASDLSNANFLVSQHDTIANGIYQAFDAISITERGYGSGEFYMLGKPRSGPIKILIFKGNYDNTNGTMSWIKQDSLGPWHPNLPSLETLNMAFSPDGQKGYVFALVDILGGAENIYSPVIWEYDVSTDKWGEPEELLINTNPAIRHYMQQIADSAGYTLSNTSQMTTCFNASLSVDMNGNPHIFTMLMLSESPYTAVSNLSKLCVDITKDAYGDWNFMKIAKVDAFRHTFLNQNASTDVSVQISRTLDGSRIFYSWNDTEGQLDHSKPNLFGRFLDVQTQLISPIVSWTENDTTWNEQAWCVKTSEYVFEQNNASACGKSFTVPTTVVQLTNDDELATCYIHYLKDITYSCENATLAPDWFHNCKQSPISANMTPTAPTCGQNDGTLTLAPSGGLGTLSSTCNAQSGQSFANLAVGTYLIAITDSIGCIQTDTLSLSSQNAPIVSVTNYTAPLCQNGTNGSASLAISGGNAPYTVSWLTSGETSVNATALPIGLNSYLVTDANQCQAAGFVSFTAVSNLQEEIHWVVDANCFGEPTGAFFAAFWGGVSPYTAIATSPLVLNANYYLEYGALLAGTYDYTITDAVGCSVSNSFTINQPALLTASGSVTNNTNVAAPYNGSCAINVSGGTPPYWYWWQLENNGTIIDSLGINTEWDSLQSGNLTIYVYDSSNCMTTVTASVLDISVSVEDANKNALQVYPNPTKDLLYVKMDTPIESNLSLRIFDATGKLIQNIDYEAIMEDRIEVNTQNLPNGIYFLQLKTNKHFATKPFSVVR